MQEWTLFLGCYVGPEGIKHDSAKVEAVNHWPHPPQSQVSAHVWVSAIFPQIHTTLCLLVTSLVNLTKKDAPFRWTPSCEEGFQGLKAALTYAFAPIVQLRVLLDQVRTSPVGRLQLEMDCE
jgi:hypothetical protein